MSQFGGGSGRTFTGRGGTDGEDSFPVLPEVHMRWGNDVLSVSLDSQGLEINVGAASLCDYVSRALLLHHANAIKSGRRASGSTQAKLDPDGGQGRLAAEGKRPSARGYTGKDESLPNVLTRSALRVSQRPVRIGTTAASGPRQKRRSGPRAPVMGFTAHANIEPANALHAQWLIDEAGRGHEFFSVIGESDHVITKVVADYLATAFDGTTRYYERGKVRAGEIGG